MKIRIIRPRNTYTYIEIGRFSSSGYHANVIEGLVIACIDIIRMWIIYDIKTLFNKHEEEEF